MRHIDRKDLYTNLEARIQYLHTFLDFGSSECCKSVRVSKIDTNANADDIEALITGAKYIKQLIPAIVNVCDLYLHGSAKHPLRIIHKSRE